MQASLTHTTAGSSRLTGEALAAELRRVVPKADVHGHPGQRHCYAYDSSFETQRRPRLPDAVVLPSCADDVAAAVAWAHERGVPVTPRGAGTGQTGGAVPAHGGIVVDLCPLNRIVELDEANLQVFCEPGVVHARLNAFLAKCGLMFPPDPGSSRMCTVGGMASNNSRGMRAIKYGATGDYVLGLDVVMPDGRLITTGSVGSRALQSSSGIDLTKLFVGSEGLFGIIVGLRLKVLPVPQAKGLVMALFDNLDNSPLAVQRVLAAGIIPSAIEILDREAIRAANIYRPNLGLPEVEALLLYEVDGSPPAVDWDVPRIVAAIEGLAIRVETSNDPAWVAKIWDGRSVIGAAAGRIKRNGARVYAGEDVCVPISAIPDALRGIHRIAARHEIPIITYGHIGVGMLHPGPVIDPSNDDEARRVLLVADEINRLALELGGTTTGEHGVGISRAPYMPAEHGAALDVMRQLKAALDPRGILNPGKVLDAGVGG